MASLVQMREKQNSVKYREVLQKSLIPFLANFHQNTTVFQQDNAAIHTSKHTREWLNGYNIHTLSWPAKSPDLNPIENLYDILARRVYADGRRFENKQELWGVVQECWRKFFKKFLGI
ncbi:hypothetical protein FHG87_015038 [Trinorchestia longiramus]|nr:hypothetical protein FHG87_015038 [Trinorchestia longiramus]